MRVVFLTEGKLAPSSRFRVQQFLEHFQNEGIECVVHYGYGDQYNRLSATKLGPAYKLLARLKRWALGLRDAHSADVLFIQRPIFPFSPLPERILHRLNPRIVFDVDDAVFLGPRGESHTMRRRTFESIVQMSAHYCAGNSYLAEAGHSPERTSVVPTVVDTDRFKPRSNEGSDDAQSSLVIGWIGSATTLWHLDEVLPALTAIRDRYPDVRIRIVANAMPPHLEVEPNFEFIPWAADSEVALLQSFDIGIMPLADLPVSKGKCGFKMIQYMAVGIPTVTSPVGANPEILGETGAGQLAKSHDEWVASLEYYVQSSERRKQAGQAARARAVANYSVNSAVHQYMNIFNDVATVKPNDHSRR